QTASQNALERPLTAGTRFAPRCHATAGAEVSEDVPGGRKPPELQAGGRGVVRHTISSQSPDQGIGGAAWHRAVRARTAVARAHRSRTQLSSARGDAFCATGAGNGAVADQAWAQRSAVTHPALLRDRTVAAAIAVVPGSATGHRH